VGDLDDENGDGYGKGILRVCHEVRSSTACKNQNTNGMSSVYYIVVYSAFGHITEDRNFRH